MESDSEHQRRPSRAVVIDDRDDSKEEMAAQVPVSSAPEDDAGHGEHALGVNYSYSDHMIVQGEESKQFTSHG